MYYWSDRAGFLRDRFEHDYSEIRARKGNRPVIDLISAQLPPCLETNLYAVPTRSAKDLVPPAKSTDVLEYLFQTIRPALVFVHSNTPIRFFEKCTGCSSFTSEMKRARWHGHEFWIRGRPGALYTLSHEKAAALGAEMARYLG